MFQSPPTRVYSPSGLTHVFSPIMFSEAKDCDGNIKQIGDVSDVSMDEEKQMVLKNAW